jgi:hypothetical protein
MPLGKKKKGGSEEVKLRKKAKGKKTPVPTEGSEEEAGSDGEKKVQTDDGDTIKIKYVAYKILLLLLLKRNSWKEEGLSERLLAAITDDPRIKQGLFPSPGANVSSSKGGGQKKTTWQWQLALHVFSDHPKYSAAIKSASCEGASKLQGVWSDKIRNRLKKMVAITRGYIHEMGQTGAGIAQEEDINMETKNDFTNKWGVSLDSLHLNMLNSHLNPHPCRGNQS